MLKDFIAKAIANNRKEAMKPTTLRYFFNKTTTGVVTSTGDKLGDEFILLSEAEGMRIIADQHLGVEYGLDHMGRPKPIILPPKPAETWYLKYEKSPKEFRTGEGDVRYWIERRLSQLEQKEVVQKSHDMAFNNALLQVEDREVHMRDIVRSELLELAVSFSIDPEQQINGKGKAFYDELYVKYHNELRRFSDLLYQYNAAIDRGEVIEIILWG